MILSCNLEDDQAAVNMMLTEKDEEISNSKFEIRVSKSRLNELEQNQIINNDDFEIDSLVNKVFEKEKGEINHSDTKESISISIKDCIAF